MVTQPAVRRGRTPAYAGRRGWLSPGLSALGISALGLAVAASVSLTTSAEVPQGGAALPMAAPTAAVQPGPTPSASPTSKVAEAFSRPSASETSLRNEALRKALVAERAAQRTEQLAKSAEAAASVDRDAAKQARQRSLVEANEASRVVAAQLAEEAVRKTAEAAAAAAVAAAAAAAASPAPTTDPTQLADPTAAGLGAPDTTNIPTGTTGVAPVPGAVVGARWGQRGLWSSYHTGIDFRAGYGTPIRSVLPGVVIYAGNSRDWAGNHVAVQHADGTTTMYSHMSSMAVGVNQTVAAGTVIGYVGATGRAFGAHLHFELYPAGVKYGDVYRSVDPQPWLNAHNVTTR